MSSKILLPWQRDVTTSSLYYGYFYWNTQELWAVRVTVKKIFFFKIFNYTFIGIPINRNTTNESNTFMSRKMAGILTPKSDKDCPIQ